MTPSRSDSSLVVAVQEGTAEPKARGHEDGAGVGMTILFVGAGAVAIFHLWVRPAPTPQISGCGHRFYFLPMGADI
jgi:hypothetical protein